MYINLYFIYQPMRIRVVTHSEEHYMQSTLDSNARLISKRTPVQNDSTHSARFTLKENGFVSHTNAKPTVAQTPFILTPFPVYSQLLVHTSCMLHYRDNSSNMGQRKTVHFKPSVQSVAVESCRGLPSQLSPPERRQKAPHITLKHKTRIYLTPVKKN